MIAVNFKYGSPEKFSAREKEIICELLVMQGKVENPSLRKINTFRMISVCLEGDEIVSVAAIKPKTEIDFDKGQSNLPELSKDFAWELGSCYTKPDRNGRGYCSTLVKMLMENCNDVNLTAVTEIGTDNPMARILDRVGFRQYGNTWESQLDHGILGLFLRYTN